MASWQPAPRPTFVTARERSPGDIPRSTRDGWLLPGGNILLALSKSKAYPGGGVVEIQKDGKVVFEYKGTQAEVNTAQAIDGQRILISEAGDKPRLLEVDRSGQILIEVPLKAQIKDHHLQTRMARKLANGNYLVPQLLDMVVREYTPAGAVVWEVKTPNMPFTAIRLDNGHTVIGCTHGNMVIEVDANGETVWQVDERRSARPADQRCLRRAEAAQRQYRDHELSSRRGRRQADRSHSGERTRLGLPRHQESRHPPLPDPRHQRQADSGRPVPLNLVTALRGVGLSARLNRPSRPRERTHHGRIHSGR